MIKHAHGLLSVGMLSLLLAFPVQADVIVIATDSSAYSRGQVLQDNDQIKIAAGSRITVLLSTNAVREIKGPFDQKVSELSQGRPSIATSLWQQVVNFFNTGGINTQSGATRSFELATAQPTAPVDANDWKSIPLTMGSSACVAEGQDISFIRRSTHSPLSLTISDANLTQVATITFTKGQKIIPWPKEITPAPSVYLLTTAGAHPKRFMLKILNPTLINGEKILETLDREGCQGQVNLWLQAASSK